MDIFFISIGVIILSSIAYFNLVATIIVFKAPGSATMLNCFRAGFIWLIPVIGFSLLLRITQQAFDCSLHYRLIPGFMQHWIYDDRFRPDYANADRNYDRARRFGMSEMHQEFRDKY